MEKEKNISLPLLFLLFCKIGCFTFGGGWSLLAQIEQEFVDKRKLATKSELLEMVAVGKSIPGIMIGNISALFGYHVAGIPGAVCTVTGIAMPAMLILSVVAVFYNSLKDNYWCRAVLLGIQAAVVPIIISAASSLGKEALHSRLTLGVFIIALILCLFFGVSNILLVLIGAAAAIVYHFAARGKDQGEEEAQ